MNWISDQIARVACTYKRVAQEVKEKVPTMEDLDEMWRKMQAALERALEPHPEIKIAVVRELEVEFGAG